MLLQIEQKQIEPGISLVELSGKLALGRESQRIESLVDELARESAPRVIFDLTKIDYIDSAGIGLLALAAGKMKQAKGALKVVTAEGRVRQMLSLTQMDTIVGLCASVEEAASSFGRTQPPATA